jgi:DNA-binding IclR family transcriptional regulator
MDQATTPERPPTVAPWTRNQQTILDALAKHGGPMRGIDIATATGMNPNVVYSYMKRFVALGVVRQVYRGEYALVPTASK